jgi:hypothetical protein
MTHRMANNMTRFQSIISAMAVMIIATMLLIPPWKHVDGSSVDPMGYGPIWQPPVASRQEGVNIFGLKLSVQDTEQANAIDWQRLLSQCGAVIIIAGVGVFVAGLNGRTSKA